MKRALLKSHNLIGDGLYVGPVAEKWYREVGKDYDAIYMYVLKDHSASLYEGMGVPWHVIYERVEDDSYYDTIIDFNVHNAFKIADEKHCHLVNAYAEIAGISADGIEPVPNYRPPELYVPEDKKNLVMVSMFSRSCASQEKPPKLPNKMLVWEHWRPLLKLLREQYPESKLALLGGPDDRVDPEKGLEVQDDEYLLAIPMPTLANYMKHAACVVTVDNGMAHLAASQRARQFYMPSGSLALNFIVPWGNKNMRLFHLPHFTQTVNCASLRWALLSAINDWRAEIGEN